MPYLIGKHPFLKLKVLLPKGNKWLTLECLIDTGFKEVAVVFMGDTQGLVGVEFLDQMNFCLDLKKRRVELN